MKKLTGPDYIPKDNKISSLVIFLHGFGADGQDLISLAPYFAQHLPNTAFFAPDGPETCEISPFGRQWFSLMRYDSEYMRRQSATQSTAFEAMLPGARDAAPVIQNYLDDLRAEYEIPAEKVALVGFSQGTMMALHVGLRQNDPLAALVGFSGALVGASRLPEEKTADCPVLLVHGEEDDMLPVHAVDLAREGLQAAGIEPNVIKRPGLPHAIDEEGIKAAISLLTQQL